MPNIAAAFGAQARQNQVYASHSTFASSQAGRKAGYIRQYQVRAVVHSSVFLTFDGVMLRTECTK